MVTGSTSHGPLLHHCVQAFCLIYSCIRLCCRLWRRQLPPSFPSFLSPPGLVSPVNTGNADWCDEEVVFPVESVGGSSSGNRAGGLLAVRWCAQSQEVVFTRLSFVDVWTLERTSDILAWLKPKIFFSSSLFKTISLPARL